MRPVLCICLGGHFNTFNTFRKPRSSTGAGLRAIWSLLMGSQVASYGSSGVWIWGIGRHPWGFRCVDMGLRLPLMGKCDDSISMALFWHFGKTEPNFSSVR